MSDEALVVGGELDGMVVPWNGGGQVVSVAGSPESVRDKELGVGRYSSVTVTVTWLRSCDWSCGPG